jgi:glycosidase
LWQTSLDVFRGEKPLRALRERLKYDVLYPDPNRLTTMLSNHDVRRTLSLEKMTLEGAMLHTAFLLSVRGTPQLYYGDEIAMEGSDDPDNRRDFPGGFAGDARDAFVKTGRDARQERMYEWTRDWLRLRREHAALRRGRLVDLAYEEEACAYARVDEHETIIIAINRAATPKTILVAAEMIDAGEEARLAPLLGVKGARPLESGKLSVFIPPQTAVAYLVQNSTGK